MSVFTFGFWRQDDDPYSDPTFVFDTLSKESFDTVVEWSKHAIEDGEDISTHGHKLQDKMSLSGRLSPCVLGTPDYDPSRVKDALEKLRTLASDRQPIVAVCSYWARDDVAIGKISASMDHTSGDFLDVSIDLVQVSTVKPKVVSMPLARIKKGAKRRRAGKSKKGGGKKTASEKSTATGVTNANPLYSLYKALGG